MRLSTARGPFRLGIGIALALLSLGCSNSDEDQELPFGIASEMRGLAFKQKPSRRRIDQARFEAETREAYESAGTDWIDETFNHYGRLGFFAKADQIESSAVSSSNLVAAYYDSDNESITTIGEPNTSTLVHELVHALQDQHFNIAKYRADVETTDERAARTAVVEGDATLAELRLAARERNVDPTNLARDSLSLDRIQGISDNVLAKANGQPLFYYAGFALSYSLGTAYAAARAGILDGAWNTGRLDALFRDDAPKSTEDVLRRGKPGGDDIEPVGLAALPEAVFARYDIVAIDRIGAWYTDLLLAPAIADRKARREIAAAWDGDQLVVLHERSPTIPPPKALRHAIVWSTIWDDEGTAAKVSEALFSLHQSEPFGEGAFRSARDGEPLAVEQRGRRVVFVKNLDADLSRALVGASFGEAAPLPPSGLRPLQPRDR